MVKIEDNNLSMMLCVFLKEYHKSDDSFCITHPIVTSIYLENTEPCYDISYYHVTVLGTYQNFRYYMTTNELTLIQRKFKLKKLKERLIQCKNYMTV